MFIKPLWGAVYSSDHAPLYLEFSLQENASGRGYWRLPKWLLSDKTYESFINNLFAQTVHDNAQLDPDVLWDLIKCNICRESIKYVS